MSLVVHALSYVHADQELLFRDIHFSLAAGEKAALVGPNGVGKSTLLQIIAGKVRQLAGEVTTQEAPSFVPQHLGQYDLLSVAEVLGISGKITALHAILAGDVAAAHFAALQDDWDIEERVADAFASWHLQHIELDQSFSRLSGEEKTKVFLAGTQINAADLILLDEPSNHLNAESRTLLYDFIARSKATILLVSHDRALLNKVDKTLELTREGIEVYGGNYDFYKKQKEGKLHALQAQLDENQKTLNQARKRARELAEQRQKQEARGKKAGQKQSLPRIVAGGLQRQAEQSTARMKEVQADRISEIGSQLSTIRAQIREYLPLRIDLRPSGLYFGKMLVDAENINVALPGRMLWSVPLSFKIRSGDRVRIEGRNGAGKTTLVKLITGALEQSQGNLQRGEFQFVYIDQDYSFIDPEKTVFEQIEQYNARYLPEADLKMLLHYHQFPQAAWDRRCAALSGGEKMKLLLCCLAVTNQAPDLLILDEPTNHLDLQSQEILTNAIAGFQGSVIVISHDQYFIDEIGINATIRLT